MVASFPLYIKATMVVVGFFASFNVDSEYYKSAAIATSTWVLHHVLGCL